VARIIPKVDVASIANGGERIIATELVRQLPESCLVYHSYPWLRLARRSNGYFIDLHSGNPTRRT
jgi:hypothetical protein